MPSGRPSSRRSGSRVAGRTSTRTSGRSGGRAGSGPASRPSPRRPKAATEAAPRRRPRLTGRAAVLVLVVAVLMVSYASSLRAYIQQRQELAGLRSDIASSQAHIASLQREKKRWRDPAYVRAQARQRFGWVLPGEVGFRVLDTDGRPLGADSSLDGPAAKQQENGPTWYETGWASIVAAGTPEDQKPKPVTTIRAPANPKQ